MKIVLNGVAQETAARTLADLLAQTGQDGRVATAVNEVFVPTGLRASHILREGDRIEVVAPMQGG